MARETSILWTEITDFPTGWGIKEHSHQDYYHLFFFVAGTGVFLINGKKYDIVPGICFLLPPGTVHGLETPKSDGLLSYEIKFKIDDPDLREHLTEEIVLTDTGDFIKTCTEFIQKNGLSRNPDKQGKVNHFMCALLLTITQNNSMPYPKSSDLVDTSELSPTATNIIVYIEANYMHHIYLDDIADFVEYNRNYMCSLFKKETGITVVDYLNYVRIRKACEYILYSDIGFSQISYRVGFINLSHFNRTFKKLVGTTPSAYSKMGNITDNNLLPQFNSTGAISYSQLPTLAQALAALKVD